MGVARGGLTFNGSLRTLRGEMERLKGKTQRKDSKERLKGKTQKERLKTQSPRAPSGTENSLYGELVGHHEVSSHAGGDGVQYSLTRIMVMVKVICVSERAARKFGVIPGAPGKLPRRAPTRSRCEADLTPSHGAAEGSRAAAERGGLTRRGGRAA